MVSGNLRKMVVELASPVNYALPLGKQLVPLNQYVGKTISLRFTGMIHCVSCGRKINKSFQQGYCFPCMRALPECDQCIVRPEKCHFHLGTCRDAAWGEKFCFQHHYVYLANSSGVKVGITRGTQIPIRWIDQGATQALPIFKVQDRYQSGLLEVALKAFVADRTDWRKMLKNLASPVDLLKERDLLLEQSLAQVNEVREKFGEESIEFLGDAEMTEISYPVNSYPEKITSLNFDKAPKISGVLQGIKGQYMIFDCGVVNIRKFAGYHVELSV